MTADLGKFPSIAPQDSSLPIYPNIFRKTYILYRDIQKTMSLDKSTQNWLVIWKILVKLDHFPRFFYENKKYLKPPSRKPRNHERECPGQDAIVEGILWVHSQLGQGFHRFRLPQQGPKLLEMIRGSGVFKVLEIQPKQVWFFFWTNELRRLLLEISDISW